MARTAPKFFKRTALFALMTACLQSTYAGVVRDDVDYQLFRDFAENKGQFTVKRNNEPANIEIFDKNGNVVETMFADGISMPDWSAVNTDNSTANKGVATLIAPQYIVSVSHNGGYQDVQFGSNDNQNSDNEKFNYKLVERNNYEKTDEFGDYHQPRLHKLVTETAPIPVVERLTNFSETPNAEKDNFRERFPVLARMGSGVQVALNEEQAKNHRDVNIGYAIDDNGKKYSKEEILANNWGELVANGYHFLTGGILLPVHEYNESQKGTLKFGSGYNLKGLNNNHNPSDKIDNISALSIGIMSGDSGSPIFAYDKNDKQWKLIALAQGNLPAYWVSSETREEFFNFFNNVGVGSLNKDEFNQEKRNQDIAGTINNLTANQIYDWNSSNDGNSTLGNLSVSLENNGNLHNGKTVYFTGEKGTLNLKSDINQGAGALYFDTDFTVKGENENITWLGAGVSVAKDKTVIWQIKNPENDRLSKIGEGVLLVNGQGENKGDISVGDGLVILNQQGGKAFNKVGIVSGRPTVKLETSDQVTEDNIYFGYRGGRLDVNGNDLTFNYIKNVDEGAKIVNHHADKTATVTIKTDATDPNKSAFNGVFGENNQDFFGNPLKDKTYHNGKLNIIYAPENPQENKPFLLSGGTNLNGNLTVENGSLLLSGRPTPHAYDHLYKDDNGNQVGIEPFKDDDWINRHFSFTNLIAKNNTTLHIGRNVKTVNGNIELNNAAAYIGFINGKTPVCVRSDYHGTTECTTPTYTDQKVLDHIIATNVTGNITLNDNSDFTLGKAHLTGEINANKDSNITLNKDAKWTMTDSGKVGHLNMENGSEITLNNNFEQGLSDKFNLLTVAGNLTGQGKFNYLTHLNEQKGDQVIVKGIASGNYTLNVKETGQEPASPQQLVLLDLQNQSQTDKDLSIQLTNAQNAVDLGAWRYELQRMNGNQYTLVATTTPPTTTPPTQMIVNSNTISKYTNLALSAQYANLRTLAHASTLGGRLLDVSPKHTGVWVHTKHGEFERASEYYRRYNDEQNLVQFGVDDDFAVGKGVLVAGVALSHAKGNQTFDEGAGDSRLTMGHLYGKWLSDKGVFIGADTGYGRVRQEVTLGKQVDYTQKFANVGVIAGKNWQFGRAFVEPSVGIRHYRALDGQGYALDGAKVQLHEFSATAYQPSIKVGYAHQTDTGLTFSPYVSTTYGHWTGDTKLAVNGYQFSVPLVSEWQHKLGFDLQKGKFSGQLYTTYDKDKESGDGYSLGLNVGYRW